MIAVCSDPLSQKANDIRSVMTSHDPKGQGHPDRLYLDRNIWKSVRDSFRRSPCSLNII